MKRRSAFLLILQVFVIASLSAQVALKSAEEEYFDFLSLQGLSARPTLGHRTLSDSVWQVSEGAEHIWQENNLGTTMTLFESEGRGQGFFSEGFYHGLKLKIYGPDWFNSFNTASPYGQNDGALWQGRGYNSSLTAGARLEGFGFELTLKPMVTFSQNMEFEMLPGNYGSEYSYFWGHGIDAPQRFGDKPYFQFDWNDSEVRYTWRALTAGFGTQAVWLGPAKLNPMLGSNNAGGIPKFDIGLKKTSIIIPKVGWNAGEVEARIWIAQLTESDYFDGDGTRDRHLFNGFNLSYSPSFWENMTVGVTKVTLTKWGNNFWMYLNPFYDKNDVYGVGEDQKASIYLDVAVPQAGFDFYMEVGMDDYTSNQLGNFFHTFIYTFGLQKKFKISNAHKIQGLLYAESNFFEMSQDFQLQWNYMGFYSHHQVREGYTQNGQLIGAGSGNFGNAQLLGFKVYVPKGSVDLFYHRNVPDMNFLYNGAVNATASEVNDKYGIIESRHTLGIKSSLFVSGGLLLQNEIDFTYIDDFMFIDGKRAANWRFVMNLKYNF